MKSKRFYIVGAILLGLCTVFTCVALGFGLSHVVKKANADEITEQNYQTFYYGYQANLYTNNTTPTIKQENIGIIGRFNLIWNQTDGYTLTFTCYMNENNVLSRVIQKPAVSNTFTEYQVPIINTQDYLTIYIKLSGEITTETPLYSVTKWYNKENEPFKENYGGFITTFYFDNQITLDFAIENTPNTILDEGVYDMGIKTATQDENAYNTGYNTGYNDGVQSQQGNITQAHQQGYNEGYAAGTAGSTNLGNILLSVGGVPFETLKSIFDFDLLGINISSLIMSILTAAVAIWLVKLFI